MDAETVAEQIEKIHAECIKWLSVIQYNNENSLSSVLYIAYLSAIQNTILSQSGTSDRKRLPQISSSSPNLLYRDYYPITRGAKWNKDAEITLNQIRTNIQESLAVYRGYFAGWNQL